MSTRNLKFSLEEYYHIYNRGVDKRIIFQDPQDYNYFIFLLKVCNSDKKIRVSRIRNTQTTKSTPLVDIGAYCLMPNHFHILLKEKHEKGISKYMLKVSSSYAMYFNKKYNRTGVLFEGFFKAIHIETDIQLKYLYAYIHLNPAKLIDSKWKESTNKNTLKIMDYIEKYPYSSIKEYIKKNFYLIADKSFPVYFTKYETHKKELHFWLQKN